MSNSYNDTWRKPPYPTQMSYALSNRTYLGLVNPPVIPLYETRFRSGSTVAYGSRTNTTITAPSGIQDGDGLVIVFGIGIAGTPPTPTPPAGFTLFRTGTVLSLGGFSLVNYFWVKIASGESGNYTISHSAASSWAYMMAFSNVDAVNPIQQSTANNGTSGAATTTATGVTTTREGVSVIFVDQNWGDTSNNLVVPTGITPQFTERRDTDVGYVATGDLIGITTTGDKSHTNNNNVGFGSPWAGYLIVVQPPGYTHISQLGHPYGAIGERQYRNIIPQ